jgi:hypothetical protein
MIAQMIAKMIAATERTVGVDSGSSCSQRKARKEEQGPSDIATRILRSRNLLGLW